MAGIYNGTLQVLSIGGENLAQLTNVTMSMNQDLFDTTSKESGGWKSVMPGLRDITYSAEGLADFTESLKYNLTELFALYTATTRTPVQIVWTNGVTGDKKVTQDAYISSMEVSAPMEDVTTYSIEFTGTGTPVITTI
jgi:TP901-1 family phage major tail protein